MLDLTHQTTLLPSTFARSPLLSNLITNTEAVQHDQQDNLALSESILIKPESIPRTVSIFHQPARKVLCEVASLKNHDHSEIWMPSIQDGRLYLKSPYNLTTQLYAKASRTMFTVAATRSTNKKVILKSKQASEWQHTRKNYKRRNAISLSRDQARHLAMKLFSSSCSLDKMMDHGDDDKFEAPLHSVSFSYDINDQDFSIDLDSKQGENSEKNFKREKTSYQDKHDTNHNSIFNYSGIEMKKQNQEQPKKQRREGKIVRFSSTQIHSSKNFWLVTCRDGHNFF
ncbi:uncharacterized protein MEPE_00784 [Melanopsichium pennsylvanicum]|uniref:Uncharacterized protein n=1 Tax=Melanopsichium pennsylvanicum TaxID=63383 RepID=A0AAJ5C312_9BASI|nr:uncharacterized protein MEPE_00784 [Melanopsichium pennsylvanicum]